jgi:hypothetical protein
MPLEEPFTHKEEVMKFAKGGFKHIYAVRLEPGEDVMASMQEFCENNGIKKGVIISGIGSLNGCSYFDPEELEGKPGLYGYGDPIELPCPIELITLCGNICTDAQGKVSLHVHASFADEKGLSYGGHFKEGNLVLTTVEMVIGEIEGFDMSRAIDPLRGVPLFTPIQL